MAEPEARERWRPTRTSVVAGAMVIVGLGLTELSWWFLLLVALGSFGPGVLREMGWLHDKDEFQRRTDHRAGYHAFLASGLVACVLVAFLRSGERAVQNPEGLATLFLALLVFTWLFSSLLAYWGAQKTATRILIGFGCAWLAFTIASNVGREWSGWPALLLHPLLTAPFFVLAWLARRRPQVTGILLLAASVCFFFLFRMHTEVDLEGVVPIFFLGPLLASGVALLAEGKNRECPDDAEEVLTTGP